MTIVAIVLAAGRGERIGGPKALLAWPLMPQAWVLPLAAAHVEAREECDRVIVVTRRGIAERLRQHAPMSFATASRGELLLSHAEDALGPAGSIAAAAAVVADDATVLVSPVDCPPVRRRTVFALLDALAASPDKLAAKPRFDGRGGHPVALRGTLLTRYRVSDPPPLRDVLRSLGDELVEVAVDDPTIAVDIDDAATLEAWSRKHGGGAIDEPAFFE